MGVHDLSHLADEIVRFREERDWAQFHTLKNLMISLNLEASELLEFAQWKTDQVLEDSIQNAKIKTGIADECGDILIYLLLICQECKIDLLKVTWAKLEKNRENYPVEKAFGSAKKYNEL